MDDNLKTLKIYNTFSYVFIIFFDWIRHIIQTFVILMRREILVGKQIVSKINTSQMFEIQMWNTKVVTDIYNLILFK